MKKYVYILIGIMLAAGYQVVAQSAVNIDVQIDAQSSFSVGEQMAFTYTFSASDKQSVMYIPHIDCPMAPVGFLETKTATTPFEDTYYGIKITDSLEPQTCAASVYVSRPFEQKFEKKFKINTKPSFNFYIFACKDKDCQERARFYLIGESFYLGYDADIEGIEILAKLKKPDNAEISVALNKATIVEQEGKYILEVIASKDGYKTMQDSLELVIVKEFTEPIDARICNINGVCEPNMAEDYKNCPEDCLSPTDESPIEQQDKKSIPFVFFLAVPILVIILIAIYFILKFKSRYEETHSIKKPK